METISLSHVPFAQLPSEARTLLHIFAMATVARYSFVRPTPQELAPRLETLWNDDRLAPTDLSDPRRMTLLFKSNSAFLLNSLTRQAPGINLADELNGGAR